MQLTGEIDLFPNPPPPKLPAQMHSKTSKAAAKRERVQQGAFRWKILAKFRERWVFWEDGITDNELYFLYPNCKQGTVRARRVELARDEYLKGGKVRDGCTVWFWTGKERG